MRRATRVALLSVCGVAVGLVGQFQATADGPAYDTAATAKWRADREASLKTPDGWLSVAGLHFLEPGVSSIGADPKEQIALPPGSGPAHAGRVRVADGHVRVELDPGVPAQLNGQPAQGSVELRDLNEAEKRPADRLTIGRATVHVHHSGDRLALRVRDPESPIRRDFVGLRWYDIDPKWQIEGRFIPFAEPRIEQVPNVLGDIDRIVSPGEVAVTIAGKPARLLALEGGKDRLWFVFTDATAPTDTYKIRFVYADAPKDGRVVIDFNRAYNPPCAYNPYTTCPLPPAQNKLKVRVTAGERAYAGQHPTSSAALR
jgi:uncharacterized protein